GGGTGGVGSGGLGEVGHRVAHVVRGGGGHPVRDGAHGLDHQGGGGGRTVEGAAGERQDRLPHHRADDFEDVAVVGEIPGTHRPGGGVDQPLPVARGALHRAAYGLGDLRQVHREPAQGRYELADLQVVPLFDGEMGQAVRQPGGAGDVEYAGQGERPPPAVHQPGMPQDRGGVGRLAPPQGGNEVGEADRRNGVHRRGTSTSWDTTR